ncbi:efflux RND transporter permease subunit [Pendulispora brunnea]|uniref:Efflux RND transporter permease subunit n=1 Tax=Pendulispora brunnea TaxID=2905690 RepID=A0ABZ2KG82_9BACT
MSHGTEAKSDEQRIASTRNIARYFVETRAVAWVLLIGTIFWGIFSYMAMPKRKDPEVQVRVSAAIVAWPGATAEKIEDLIVRKMETTIAENQKIEKIESTVRQGVAVITITLVEGLKDVSKELDDLALRLAALNGRLPQGASPINYLRDFGDTTNMMLTVASPRTNDIEVQLRARPIERLIRETRAGVPPEFQAKRGSLVYAFPVTLDPKDLRRTVQAMGEYARLHNDVAIAHDVRFFEGPGFMGLDAQTDAKEGQIRDIALSFLRDRMRTSEIHPDVWRAAIIFDPAETETRLREVAEAKYSYRELDDFTDAIQKRLLGVPIVSRVTRSGVLPERVFLDFSQEKLASYGLSADQLSQALSARNITTPAGVLDIGGKSVGIDASGELRGTDDLKTLLVATSTGGQPVYLRDVVDVTRGYESPPSYLNRLTRRTRNPSGADGQWERTRAVTLGVFMRSGAQIQDFGNQVDAALAEVGRSLPEDLVIARTSDQPRQVVENVDLFMRSLFEAVALVVVVALIGFWEWRSALMLALCIPITLTLTFGIMKLLGIDVQQISIASLIIALGLLVDNPVVACDSIKQNLGIGHPRTIATWLGPTKLAMAIIFATITNIVAYLPFLSLPGDVGNFIFTLPVVLTTSLIASLIVSYTFTPVLAYYLLKPPAKLEPTMHERRQRGFGRFYERVVGRAIDRRWWVLGGSVVLLVLAFGYAKHLKNAFFPHDLSYLSYIDVWLPEDAPIAETNEAVRKVDEVVRTTLDAFEKTHVGESGKPEKVLKTMTTFVGGGGPRFWFSVVPEQQQVNYAQVVLEVYDKHQTAEIIGPLQQALSREVPGARIDVRELENGKPVGIPVAVRISGEDMGTLRTFAEKAKSIFREAAKTERVRDDWGEESFQVKLEVDADRANLAGVTNLDVARSSAGALDGLAVGTLRERDHLIPIVLRLRAAERAALSDVENLYVQGSISNQRIPLRQVSNVTYGMVTEKIKRRNQFRTVTVSAMPERGTLPSEIMKHVHAPLAKLSAELPPGFTLEIAGEEEEQVKGFKNLVVVLGISIACIFLALVIQFKSATKPMVLFAAIPYGVAGALVSLTLMDAPFGFMAFLGIISLIGVIVSHVIVLFDFIEERHAEGDSLRDALIDAGILRVRPVLITVAATVFALFPLAVEGGPLWEPLCYAQIGGLTVATFVTLLIVPVLYSIFVLDLKIVKWEGKHE